MTYWRHFGQFLFININNVLEDSRFRPICNTLFASTHKLRCVRRGLRPRDVCQRKATQTEAELKRFSSGPFYVACCWLTFLGRKHCRASHTPYYMKTWRHPQNRKYITSDRYRATTTGNMYRKFRELRRCGFWDMWVDRQTFTHADRNTSHPSRRRGNNSLCENTAT